jgi:hypothetical protein
MYQEETQAAGQNHSGAEVSIADFDTLRGEVAHLKATMRETTMTNTAILEELARLRAAFTDFSRPHSPFSGPDCHGALSQAESVEPQRKSKPRSTKLEVSGLI